MSTLRTRGYFWIAAVNLPDSSTYYSGAHQGNSSLIGVGAPGTLGHVLPLDVTLIKAAARCAIQGSLGSAEEIDVQLDLNNGGTVHSLCQLSTTSRINYATSADLSHTILTTDVLTNRLDTPAWVTNPTNVKGITTEYWFETGLNRDLMLIRFYGTVGLPGGWNPADRTVYYLGMSNDFVGSTAANEFIPQFDGAVIGASISARNNAATNETFNTEIDVDGGITLIDGATDWSATQTHKVIPIDTINIPFTAGQRVIPRFNTPTWAVNPIGTSQTIDLLIERT